MKALVIVNPVAGGQRPLVIAETAAAHLRESGWEVCVEPTERAGHASELAAAAGPVDQVIAIGGDGTLRETVAGLDGRPVPVGFVPIGKANVMARELGIPRKPAEAIQLLVNGAPRSIDVGTVGDRIFLAMVGIGYDGWVTAGVDAFRARGWGQWLYRHGGSTPLYVLAGLPAMLRLRPERVRVEADGIELGGAYPSATFSNAEIYSIGWAMTPGARADDGRLDHQVNRRSAPWFVAWTLLAAILKRRLPGTVADYGSARTYRVRAARPFRWQVDGDPMPAARELEIGILPGHARIIVPAGAD